jgi:hypothetical protein
MSVPFNVVSLADLDTDSIMERLLALKDKWELRSEEYSFYTLGKSAYLEGKTPEYKEQYKELNKLLVDTFPDLYITLVNYVAMMLGQPVRLADDLAFPGFHIFEADESFENIAGNWHQDFPQDTLGLKGKDNSTVTVAIKIPKSGAGIDWIDTEGKPHHLAYNEKDVVWHNGLTVHRIAGFKEIVKGEYRVTLQGHLIRRANGFELYW